MDCLDRIAEERILQAQREGAFENLPGNGKPLVLDDDSMIPPELRAAYRILRNAGYAPPEVLVRRDIAELEAVLADPATDAPSRRKALARLHVLRARLGAAGRDLRIEQAYWQRLVERMTHGGKSSGG